MNNTKNATSVSEFFKSEFVDYASYSTIRMMASAIDGMKNANRKIVYTIFDKNIKKPVKVSRLASTVSEYTEYLHGDISGVISGMGQYFAGSNNSPLLAAEGSFGNRFSNAPSAARYIYTNGTDFLFSVLNKEDDKILIEQLFEGEKIEPRFYLPTLPLIFINGANGIASGFKQTILGRNSKDIIKYLKAKLNGKNIKFTAKPYYNGFNGKVEKSENNQWKIYGNFVRKSATVVEITELPIGIELSKYNKILDDLKDKNKITSYKDLSDKGQFKFEVKFKKEVLKKYDDLQILERLKLVKTETEIYNAIDEDLRVRTFKTPDDLINYYYNIKIKYLEKRKSYLLDLYKNQIEHDLSKYTFIKMIVEDKLKINKRKTEAIIKDLDKVEKIIKHNNSYNYLLSMQISSLTKEQMDKLKKQINDKLNKIKELKTKTAEEIWLEDLNKL